MVAEHAADADQQAGLANGQTLYERAEAVMASTMKKMYGGWQRKASLRSEISHLQLAGLMTVGTDHQRHRFRETLAGTPSDSIVWFW